MNPAPLRANLFGENRITSNAWHLWYTELKYFLDQLSGGSGTISPANTVVDEIAYDQASSAGSSATFSRGDHTHGTPSDIYIPSANEHAALAGSSGSPSANNTYVTDTDSRMSDARTPANHAISHAANGSDALTLTKSQISDLIDWTNATDNLVTTGDVTCDTLNYTTLNPPVTSSPGGADTQVQYNNSGVFGADAGFTTDKAGSLTLSTRLTASELLIDTDTLAVNIPSYTDKVGIKTATPSEALDVNGHINLANTLKIGTNTVLDISGTDNVHLGVDVHTAGSKITAIGHQAGGGSLSGATCNTVMGYRAGGRITSGDFNAAIGAYALEYIATGSKGTAVGYKALNDCIGSDNTAIGSNAGEDIYSGIRNTLVGSGAGASISSCNYSTIIGCYAGFNLKEGPNTLIGYNAGYRLGNQIGSVFIGCEAGYYETTSNKLYIENSNSATPLIYGEFDNNFIRINANTAITNTIHNALKLNHCTSGTAAALYGISSIHELEDAAGNQQTASDRVTLWSTATSGAESPLLRETTYPIGSAGPGYRGLWTWNDLDGTSRTVIPNGAGDVTAVLTIHYAVSESAGGTSGGSTTVDNNATVDIYSDGTDVCTVTVAADGSVTIARSAGAATFDVVLNMVWI